MTARRSDEAATTAGPRRAPGAPLTSRPSAPVLASTQDTAGWARITLAGGVALFLAMVLEHLLWTIAYPLGLVFGAVVIAQGVAPVVNWLSRWLPRPLAGTLFYFALFVVGAVGAWFIAPVLGDQASLLLAEAPVLEAGLRALADEWTVIDLDAFFDMVRGQLGRLTGELVRLPVVLVSAGTNAVLVLFLSLYWTIAQPQLRGWVLGLVPEDRRDKTRDVLGEAGGVAGGYVRGVAISALVIGTFTYLGLRAIGLPNPLALAVLAGFGELIPVLGPFLSAIPALAVALVAGEREFLLVLAFYIGLQQVESNLLLPLIMRGQARIPPLLSLVAFLVGVAVGGVVGALIAIPLFGALRVVAVRVLVPAERGLVGVSGAEADAVHREEVGRGTAEGGDDAWAPP